MERLNNPVEQQQFVFRSTLVSTTNRRLETVGSTVFSTRCVLLVRHFPPYVGTSAGNDENKDVK